MKRRSTIAKSPLDEMIPAPGPSQPVAKKQGKVSLLIYCSAETADRVKNAVYHTPGMTLAQLGEEALAAAVDRLEKKRGEPFPARPAALRVGRPVAT